MPPCSHDRICHRDIKPQNLLVEGHTHALKPATWNRFDVPCPTDPHAFNSGIRSLRLCDFGSAKPLVRGEPNVAYICPDPELLRILQLFLERGQLHTMTMVLRPLTDQALMKATERWLILYNWTTLLTTFSQLGTLSDY